jgi:cytochrome b subunit of formate dehydrogenase/nitrate reductase cytochrome c-type subunit
MRQLRFNFALIFTATALALLLSAAPAIAYDTDGCLSCHQYRGLSRIDPTDKSVQLYYVDPNYYSMPLGPHSRLKCTDCHLRSEVQVFPHKIQTPVNCTQTCHLSGPNQVEVLFAHKQIDQMLSTSIHSPDKLAQSNQLLGSPLKAGQAQCLLCHEEPSYTRGGQTWLQAQAPIARCNTCHEGQLAIDTQQFYSHVTSRAHPARTNEDLTRLCAVCHSNPAVRAKFKMPDATVSYLASFHGKATMLGSQEAANCLDCHAGQGSNVHQILQHTNSAAPTSAANLPDTCRAPACHRGAGTAISSASVHLNLSTTPGIEWFIAVVFVFLIVFTFGPSLLLTALKMLEIATGRHDPEEHHRLDLVRQLMQAPAGRVKLQRFTLHQRIQHWFLAVCFITLVLTGMPMKFADKVWAQWLIGEFGGLAGARRVHHVAGAALIVGLFYHLIYILRIVIRQAKTSGQNPLKVLFNLPMFVKPTDGLEMLGLMLYLLKLRKTRPGGARFNAEEKFEYIGVFWGSIVLGTTGIFMWFNAWTTQHLPGRILTIATLIHTMEAFLALLHVGIVHMVSVIFAPHVFPVSKAMFSGETPAHELTEAHGEMIDAAVASAAVPEVQHG